MDRNKKLFPQRLWDLVSDPKNQHFLRWSQDGQQVYLNRNQFEEQYLRTSANQFHTQKAISFVRQMNMYGFKKVDDCHYENAHFKRGHPQLIKNMVRRNSNRSHLGHEAAIEYIASETPLHVRLADQHQFDAQHPDERTATGPAVHFNQLADQHARPQQHHHHHHWDLNPGLLQPQAPQSATRPSQVPPLAAGSFSAQVQQQQRLEDNSRAASLQQQQSEGNRRLLLEQRLQMELFLRAAGSQMPSAILGSSLAANLLADSTNLRQLETQHQQHQLAALSMASACSGAPNTTHANISTSPTGDHQQMGNLMLNSGVAHAASTPSVSPPSPSVQHQPQPPLTHAQQLLRQTLISSLMQLKLAQLPQFSRPNSPTGTHNHAQQQQELLQLQPQQQPQQPHTRRP